LNICILIINICGQYYLMFLRKVHFREIYFIIYLLPIKTTTKYSLTLIAICLYNLFYQKS